MKPTIFAGRMAKVVFFSFPLIRETNKSFYGVFLFFKALHIMEGNRFEDTAFFQ